MGSVAGRSHVAKPKANPLTGYEKPANITVRDVDRVGVPLISPHAERQFAQVLANVPFNLHVVVVPGIGMGADPRISRIVQDLKWKGFDTGTFYAVCPVNKRRNRPDLPKWASDRSSPFTPFMVLHRIFDEEFTQERVRQEFPVSWWVNIPGIRLEAFASAGVDTAAGRNGALGDAQQMLADLWAKWCITGRIALDPKVCPAGWDARPRNEEEKELMRSWVSQRVASVPRIKAIFEELALELMDGGARLIE